MSAQLREEFETVRKSALDVIHKAQQEKRELTAEEMQENDRRFARCDQIRTQIDEEAKFATLKVADLPAEVLDVAKSAHDPKDRQDFNANVGNKWNADRHAAAVNKYLRGQPLERDEFTIVSGAGGVTLPAAPPVVIKRVRNPFKAALQAYGYSILNVSGFGNAPVFDDSANSADVIAQNSTSENVKEPAITNLTGDVLYDSGTVWFSNTYLGQAGFEPLSYLRPMLDARLEAAETTAWTATMLTGAGVGVTAASTTAITYQEIVNLKYSLPVVAQQDGVFLASSGMMAALEGLVDGNGRPLYRMSLSDDSPDKLLGWPIFVVADLATPGAASKSLVAASASALIAREFGPRRLVKYENIPTRPDQVGIREFANGGFGIFAGNVKVLQQHA